MRGASYNIYIINILKKKETMTYKELENEIKLMAGYKAGYDRVTEVENRFFIEAIEALGRDKEILSSYFQAVMDCLLRRAYALRNYSSSETQGREADICCYLAVNLEEEMADMDLVTGEQLNSWRKYNSKINDRSLRAYFLSN